MAEGGGLLNRYRVVKPYRGFESLRLRQIFAQVIVFTYLSRIRATRPSNCPTSDPMARKPPPSATSPDLNPQKIRQGIERLRKRISELENFVPTSVKERWAPETKALEAAIADTIDAVFGHNAPRANRFEAAANLDRGGLVLGGGPDPLYKVQQWLAEGKADALALLRQAVSLLEEDLAELGEEPHVPINSPQKPAISNEEIFIVHGRDTPAKHEVELLVERAGLKPVILHRQANEGRTVIEKFEDHGGTLGSP